LWYGFLLLAIAALAAGCSIFLYNWLNEWRWSVSMNVSASAQVNSVLLPDLRLTGRNSSESVQWQVEAAYARQLTVTGAGQGTAEVILPLRRSQCSAIAAKLKTKCTSSGQLTLPSPVTFSWSRPMSVGTTNGGIDSASSLEIAQTVADPGAPQMTITPVMHARPSFCYDSPQQPVRLTITSGLNTFPYSFTGREPSASCAGASIVAGLGGSTPPVLQFSGLAGLHLWASAQAATMQGFAGQLALDSEQTRVIGPPENVIICSQSASCPLTATIDIGQVSQFPNGCPLASVPDVGQAGQSLALCSSSASSVITKDGELVPSAWARQTDVFAPLLGALVTAAVVGPLTVFMQLLMDALRRWQGPAFLAGRRRGLDQPNEERKATDVA